VCRAATFSRGDAICRASSAMPGRSREQARHGPLRSTMRKVAKAAVGAKGIDTVTSLTADQCNALRSAGVEFAVRYLGSITSEEVDSILGSGMAVMPVTYSRKPGWSPSADVGRSDGASSIYHLGRAGLPCCCTVWLDLEEPGGAKEDVIAYVNAWSDAILQSGYIPGLYVGAGVPLSGEELYHLKSQRYWHSQSVLHAAPQCEWCMYQLYPSTSVAGVWADVNYVQQDRQGRVPAWVVGG
jgi:hypothetical protein